MFEAIKWYVCLSACGERRKMQSCHGTRGTLISDLSSMSIWIMIIRHRNTKLEWYTIAFNQSNGSISNCSCGFPINFSELRKMIFNHFYWCSFDLVWSVQSQHFVWSHENLLHSFRSIHKYVNFRHFFLSKSQLRKQIKTANGKRLSD